MKTLRCFVFAFTVLFVLACGGNKKTDENAINPHGQITKEDMYKNLKSMETKLYAKQQLDESAAMAMVNQYADYAANFPDDSIAPDCLFKAGEICSSLKQGKQAIDFFKQITEKYPNYKKAHFCLFLEAFVYETQLKDLNKAKELYMEVIQKYPNDKMAIDAQASIQNLGKSDEELIKEFEAKNKGK